MRELVVEGGYAQALSLKAHERLRIINIEGSQVVDVWALCPPDLDEFLSTEHTRSCLEKLIPATGDSLYTNLRRPILTIVEDTSPGVHDLLLSACDPRRYELLGCETYHRNCADNFREALAQIGHVATELPSPFNVFENVSLEVDGSLSIQPPQVSAGQFVTLELQLDAVLVLSACPMDIAKTNGEDGRAKPVAIQVLAAD
jgi:uncharacterized protein